MFTCSAIPIERGCGSRVEDGIYWETGIGPDGRPVEAFVFDPPILVSAEILDSLPYIGVKLMQVKGVWHIFDRVGREHYPNATDFIEEARRYGVSRRLPSNLDFSKLTMDSRLIVLHDHGYLENYATLERDGNGWICPNGNQHHQPGHAEYCCTGVLYEVVEPLVDDHREMPSFAYQARSTPAGMTPQFASAFIASFPLTRLVVVNGHKAQHRRDQIATQTSVLVEVVEQ